jgi:hypothetical protein
MRERTMLLHRRDPMTGCAHFGLRSLLQNRIARGVTAMTGGTCDVVAAVGTAMPSSTDIRVVTAGARRVLNRCRCRRVRAEENDRRALLPCRHSPSVIAAGAMTRLALQLVVAERRTLVRPHAVRPAKDGKRYVIVVTIEASVGARARIADRRRVGFSGAKRTAESARCQ